MPPVISLAFQILGILHLVSKEVEGLTPSYTIAHKIASGVDEVANLAELIQGASAPPAPSAAVPGVAGLTGK